MMISNSNGDGLTNLAIKRKYSHEVTDSHYFWRFIFILKRT